MNSTKTLEQVESAQLGLGIIRSLIGIDADEVQNAKVKAYEDGNMRLWQSRSGLEATGLPESEKSDDMGHTVSIGNATHYHYEGGATMSPGGSGVPPPAAQPAPEPAPPVSGMSNLAKAGIGAALLGSLLAAGLGGAALMRPDSTGGVDTDSTLSVSIPEEDRTK